MYLTHFSNENIVSIQRLELAIVRCFQLYIVRNSKSHTDTPSVQSVQM